VLLLSLQIHLFLPAWGMMSGYDAIFSEQLKTLGQSGDSLLVFSGSGNSPNIVEAIKIAKTIGITSYAIVGFSGGQSEELADHSIHIQLDDMQISEDFQCIVGHMLMQWLNQNNPHARL
jgi:D-sedoheptulose 7-phosphate isomerase